MRQLGNTASDYVQLMPATERAVITRMFEERGLGRASACVLM